MLSFKAKDMIGITGGAATGKSTVLGFLEEAGYSVASADAIAKSLRSTTAVRDSISKALGLPDQFTDADLRARVFGHDEDRAILNKLMWPLIWQEAVHSNPDFFEAPQLIEAALQSEFQEIWVTVCSQSEQERRLKNRGLTMVQIESLRALQAPAAAQIAFADVVIRTNQSKTSVKNVTLTEARRALRESL